MERSTLAEGSPAPSPQLSISSTGDAGQGKKASRQTRSRKASLDSKLGESGNKAAPRKKQAGNSKARQHVILGGQDHGDDSDGSSVEVLFTGPPAATQQLRNSSDAGQVKKASRQTRSRKARLDSNLGESGNKSRDKAAPRKKQAGNSKAKQHVCPVCGKDWPSASKLERHATKHTGEKPFECDVCGKKFGVKGNLDVHMRVHTAEKPYECDECGKNFSMKQSLEWHMRIHSGEKPYECDLCGKKFTLKGTLDVHKRVHGGAKPYECDECGKTFLTKQSLEWHGRIHTGEKPYECSVCQKKFTLKGTLDTHMRVHTGEKPYECEVCFKKFTHRSQLSLHRKVHAPETQTADNGDCI